ncbi:MAG TPA: RsmD family RNA methyltransferase [Gemmataceae bacterium]|jgi:16S rRNA (guanine(966)-N(2))-methyltransferase RsmD|nr:RsmD family RNA methyltransferase [Gemmataceae bacterium]
MQTSLRIVSGLLRGRKLNCTVEPGLRPMPDRVRESLFSILTSEIASRPFFDLFAGTGAVGMEGLSRGAIPVTFVEFDGKTAGQISRHLKEFGVADRGIVLRADVYRWASRWLPPAEPLTIFLGPPFPDLTERPEKLMDVVATLLAKLPPDSVLVIQTEKAFDEALLPQSEAWRHLLYGRNRLSVWRSPVG